MIKRALFAIAGVITIMAPLSLGAVAHASEIERLQCSYPQIQTDEESGINGCDLGIDKQVSVDGGNTFVEADTSADAAQTTVGSTVIWQITVSNHSEEGYTPYGTVTVDDILPSAGVSYVSSSATVGAYDNNSGTWVIPLTNGDEGTNLPATLTIITTSTATGLFENTATLSVLDSCNDGCTGPYADFNSDNNSNSAWFDPSAKPQVLAATTTTPTASSGQVLADTGSASSVIVSMIAATIIVSTIAVTFISRAKRV